MSDIVKKKGDRLDCHSCKFHSPLYDRHGKVTGHWCVKRNGRLRKRFRGDCKYISGADMRGDKDERKQMGL